MKRTERYCDSCGKQMTYLDNDYDQNWRGVHLQVELNDVITQHDSLYASMSKPHSCGSSGKAEWMRGSEFCSFACFKKEVDEWVGKIAGFWK